MAANSIASALEKEQIFGMAEKEMEYRVDMFNSWVDFGNLNIDEKKFDMQIIPKLLTQTCFKKCIENKYKESELNMGENSCIDRCVSKYWQVTNLVGQLLGTNQPPM